MSGQNSDNSSNAQRSVAGVITRGNGGDAARGIGGGVARTVARGKDNGIDPLGWHTKAYLAIIARATRPLTTLGKTADAF